MQTRINEPPHPMKICKQAGEMPASAKRASQQHKKLMMAFIGCLAASFALGRTIPIDLRLPGDRNGASAKANVSVGSAASGNAGFVRTASLDAGAADVGAVAVGDELAFTLFDDVTITLTLKNQMPSLLTGDVFLAEASGYEGVKNAVVLRTEEGLTVDIQDYSKGKVYKVISTSSGVVVQEIEPTGEKKCGCDTLEAPSLSVAEAVPPERHSSEPPTAKSISSNPDPLTIDILVAYDTTAAKWAKENGGGLQQFAETAVQKMNTALYNSLGGKWYVSEYLFVFRLVGVYEIGGPGFVKGDDSDEACCIALKAAREGTVLNGTSWAGIADKRDEVGADIVTTLIDTGKTSGTVGIGYSFQATSSGFSGWAYNCCAIRSVAESHTMTHECGHNMGAGHATEVNPEKIEPGPQYYPYSAGYHFKAANTNCHTIMAYNYDGFGNNYKGVPYFSSPDVTYAGVATGDSSHNNALTLKNNYAVVAAFRKSKEEMEEQPQDELPVETGEFCGFSWRTCERFPWQAYTNYTWISGIGYRPGSIHMISGEFRTGGDNVPLTGESWIETSVTGPARLAFKFETYMMDGPFKVLVDGSTAFSTRSSIRSWADVDVPEGTHTVRFVFVANGWYCSNDTYNGVHLYDVRLDSIDYRPAIVPASTDSEYTAKRFTAPMEIQITNNAPSSVIYYTLDDSEPTENSKVYNGPFTITNSTIVKAVARQADGSLTMTVSSLYLERHPVQPGEWTADAEGAISAAAANGNLVVVQYSRSSNLGNGTYRLLDSYASITDGHEFTDWAKRNGVYLIAYDESSMMYERGRFLEEASADNYFRKLRNLSSQVFCIARAWLPYEAICMSSLEVGSYVGGVRYDGTAATLIKGLETYLQSGQRPGEGSEVTVSFDPKGGTMEQMSRRYKSGRPFGELPVPRRRLYRFNGWQLSSDDASKRLSASNGFIDEETLVPYADVHLYATWTLSTVSVVFDRHFYEKCRPEYRSYDYEEKSYTKEGTYDEFPNVWSLSGYQFAGWFDAPEGGSPVALGDSIPATATDYSVTNHARWTANSYRVVFHSKATDEYPVTGKMDDQDFVYGEAQTLSPNRFSRLGYEFKGWSVYSNYNYTSYLDGALVSNLTAEVEGVKNLYAVWEARGYQVRFNANDDSDFPATGTMQKQFFDFDEENPLAKNCFVREGYDFGGWTTYAQGLFAQYADGQKVKNLAYYAGSVVDLYAFWIPRKVTITFQDDREYHKKYTVNKYAVGSLFHNVPIHVSTDAHFMGWFTKPFGGERIRLGKTRVPDRDTTYYAQWTESSTWTPPAPDADVCTIVFDANGGELASDESVWKIVKGSALGEIVEVPEPAKYGYDFDGWWTDAISGYQVYDSTVVTGDATFYAHWTAQSLNSWDVSAVSGGVAIKGCSFPYGKIEIPSRVNGRNVVAIADYAFFGQKGITEVVIPDSVTTVGVKAFKGCSNLTKATLPARLATLGQAAFQDCVSLTEVDVPALGDNYLWSSTFEGCTALKRVSLPEGITAIGTSSFANCKALVEVNIPKSVRNIKSFAFFSCEKLSDVELPSKLAKIEQKAFKNCVSMTAIEIPSGVTSLGKAAFFNSGLVEATVPGNIAKVDDYCFQKCAALKKMTLSEGVKETGASVWANDGALEEVVFPKSLEKLGGYAFFRCPSLATLWNFSSLSNLSTIGEKAFKHCTSLKTLTMPSQVTALPKEMCNYCSSLEGVYGTERVTSIGQSAFSNCPKLKSIAGLDAAALALVKRGREYSK